MTHASPDSAVLRPSPRRGLVLAIALAFAAGLVPVVAPTPARAATAETIESQFLTLVNNARLAKGLMRLRSHGGLAAIAGYRAGVMASTGTLSHTVAGNLSSQITARGIPWYGNGEIIAFNTYPWGDQSARTLYDQWRNSPGHWALLMSATFNYVGVGVAYRSANRGTYASVVFTESPDLTPPWANMLSVSRSGTTVYWSWTGGDITLQSHTSGLRNFDVQYRAGYNSWATIRFGTTARSMTLSNRAHGRWYGVRVRSRDWRGYVSRWTSELRIWVP